MDLSPEEIRRLLNLVPHPTCGFVDPTFLSKIMLPKAVLPAEFGSDRSAGSAMYFMVTQETTIKLHKIRSDQLFHFYFGDPLEVLLLYPDGQAEIKVLGDDIRKDMRPQLFIPANTFHIYRVQGRGVYSLLATTEWIGVEPQDVELGDPNQLIASYPAMKKEILAFTGTEKNK